MGPLAGFRIVEFAGIGPGPMAAMLFADLGARVIRIDRISASDLGIAVPTRFELLTRSRPSVAVNLKHPDGIALAIDLCGRGRWPDRRLPPRHDGAARPWPRRSPGAQSAPCLRAHDRLGTDRAARASCWPRSQLPRSGRRAARHRARRHRSRRRRSIWSRISVAARSISLSAWPAPCSKPSAPARVRLSTRR